MNETIQLIAIAKGVTTEQALAIYNATKDYFVNYMRGHEGSPEGVDHLLEYFTEKTGLESNFNNTIPLILESLEEM